MPRKCKNSHTGKTFAIVVQIVPQRNGLAIELISRETFDRAWFAVPLRADIVEGDGVLFVNPRAARGVANHHRMLASDDSEGLEVFDRPLPYAAADNPVYEMNHRGKMVKRREGNPDMVAD